MQSMNVIPNEIIIPLPRKVDMDLADEIEKESVFVSPYLERIHVEPDLASVKAVLRGNPPLEEVRDKAVRYLESMAKQVSGYETKVSFENKRQDSGSYLANANQALIDAGWLHDYGKGQVAYSGPVLKLARLIDAQAKALYIEKLGAVEGQYPALIDGDDLRACGYFDSHPNAVSFVGNMVEDFDAIESFRVANSCSEGALMPPGENVHVAGMCLNPAACFPCYPTLTGKTFSEGSCLSWLGRVFRYESRNITGLERLFEFNVRELVFIGPEEYTADTSQKAGQIVKELVKYFDLDAKLQSATDPFFATVSAARKYWQQAQDVKSEIKISFAKDDGEIKTMACGSVNLHGNFFGTRFNIQDGENKPANTGCVGLGIERWVLACFSQHGLDPERWPEKVRKVVFDTPA